MCEGVRGRERTHPKQEPVLVSVNTCARAFRVCARETPI
nr:MAG TPA: hypothetical protein [Microviridae sp.]